SLNICFLTYVTNNRQCLAPGCANLFGCGVDRSGQFWMRFCRLGQQHDVGAIFCQTFGNCQADTAAAARNQDGFLMQSLVGHPYSIQACTWSRLHSARFSRYCPYRVLLGPVWRHSLRARLILSMGCARVMGMEISTAIVLCILIAVICFGAGIFVGSRLAANRTTSTDDAALREQLATAQTRAELLERQRHEDRGQFQSQQQIVQMLGPLSKQLEHLGGQVSQLERDRGQQYGQLSQQLRTAHATDAALLENTHKLVASLRSSSARGHWGEVQLRRIVEAAGMLRHTDFDEQVNFSTDTAERDGEVFRPDMLVHLPGEKSLVVDAKAPMSAILQAGEVPSDGSEEEQRRRAELEAAHARAVRTHIKSLSTKKYWAALD